MNHLSPSAHCRERWAERFPGHDMDAALSRACYAPRRLLYRACRGGWNRFRAGSEYWLDPTTRAVFPIVREGAVRTAVTVFALTALGVTVREKLTRAGRKLTVVSSDDDATSSPGAGAKSLPPQAASEASR